MNQRLICILLIPFLLANQAIALGCPHQHQGSAPDSPQKLTHIHIGFHSHHDHNHRVASEHGESDHEHRSKTLSDHESTNSWQTDHEDCHHDCDAIYVPLHELRFLPSVYQIEMSVDFFWVAVELPFKILTAVFSDQSWPNALKGPFSLNRCALYLQVSSIRI